MKVNNEIYETQGHGWWVDDAGFGFSSLRLCLNPVRYGYFKRKMSQMNLSVTTVLDVGCGGGYLAEAFARDGFIVAGVDPAASSIEAARKHACETGLNVDYRVGRSETLPFSDGCFDAVACCDVLEHVDDLDKSVSEVGRVLRPGGVFFYETVNRTWRANWSSSRFGRTGKLPGCVNPIRMYGRNSSNRENSISSWDAIPLSIRTGKVFHRRTETRSQRSGHFAQSQEVGSAAKISQTNLASARRPA